MEPATSTVLFDEACPLCQSLAALAARRAGPELAFASWQRFRSTTVAQAALGPACLDLPADTLRVFTGQTLYEGEDAWAYLLAKHPDLHALNWLADRLNLARGTARGLNGVGHLVRRFCRRCSGSELR